jgi:TolB-like protein/tetratricopeptide (TPR) repeat protein
MLVVLPFQDLGPAGEGSVFADGITDEMIGQLGALDPGRLGVIARTTSMQYRGSAKSVMEIGKELTVEYLLEGSVRRDANRVRITAQLVDVMSQTQLWTESYERDLKDVLMLQRDVAGRIARSLAGGALSPVLAREAASPSFAAYELVLKGRALRQEATEESAWKCAAAFEEAIRLAPGYAPAHAGLGDCYRLLGAPGWEAGPPAELLGRARQAVDKAIALDPNLADSYATRAMVRMNLDWDLTAANDDIDRAVALNPSHARANQYRSAILTAMGRFDEAVEAAKLAQHLDPLSITESTTLGVRLYYARRFPEAVDQLKRTATLNPRFAVLSWGLGETYRELGQHDQAIAHLRTAVELSGQSPYMRAWLAHALATGGQREEASAIRGDLEHIAARQFVSPFLFALIASGFGDRASTMNWLQKTFDARSGWMPFVPVEPQFRWLHDDQAFKALVARVHP